MTPQEKLQAFESMQRLGKMFPGVLESFRAWAEIGSLEQAAAEATNNLANVRAAQSEAQAKHQDMLDRLDAEAEARRKAADAEIARMQADASHFAAAKKAAADDLLSAAQQRAQKMLAKAEADAGKAADSVKAAMEEHAGWLAKIADVEQQHAEVTTALEAAQAELARVQGIIAEAKAKF